MSAALLVSLQSLTPAEFATAERVARESLPNLVLTTRRAHLGGTVAVADAAALARKAWEIGLAFIAEQRQTRADLVPAAPARKAAR